MPKFTPELEEARMEIGRAITRYAQLKNRWELDTDQVDADEDAEHRAALSAGGEVVVAWVAGYEWTNVQLEQADQAGRNLATGADQPLSASAGLGQYIANRFG